MYYFIIWIGMVVATAIIADQKNLSVVGFLFLGLFLAPVALLLVLLLPKNEPKTKEESPNISLSQAITQLNYVKSAIASLNKRVEDIDRYIGQMTNQEHAEVSIIEQPSYPQTIAKAQQEKPQYNQTSTAETNFGKYWLNKIGIIVFALGIGFLIRYTFKYFGPFIKIAFGYFISAGLFYFGLQLEKKDKLANYGRALLGGAWALVYFTTYAMHHFEASRIIQSQMVDLFLLVVVIVGMIKHALKYESEAMVAMALIVAYLTSIIGQITIFTFISNILLSVVIITLVYKFRWIKTLILGIILTFLIHHIWVMPEILHFSNKVQLFGMSYFHSRHFMNLAFLGGYWLVFMLGLHILRRDKEEKLENTVAAANLGNFAFFSFISYPLLNEAFLNYRFLVIFIIGLCYLAAALIMKIIKNEKLYFSDIVVAVMAITLAIPLKFHEKTTLLIWLIETPFLLLVGLYFRQKIYRYLSYGISALSFVQLIISLSLRHDYLGWANEISFLGLMISFNDFLVFCAAFSMGICCYLGQKSKEKNKLIGIDDFFNHVFSLFSCSYFVYFIYSVVSAQWITLYLLIPSLFLFGLGNYSKLKRLRVYSYVILLISTVRYIFIDNYAFNPFLKWTVIIAEALVFFAIYFTIKTLKQRKEIDLLYAGEGYLSFYCGVALIIFTVFRYVSWQWISLGLGVAGVIFIATGLLFKDKPSRISGLLLFGLTIVRITFVDLSQLDVIFKIISFIILGIIFLGISYIYNRFNIGQEKAD
ncbi:MAG: hypothetical protein A2243_03515 [Omnitrophica WOR_2 bacterium RIFOXYA2_FULL_38_17]|nr:MAG: hypothetical protein A2243_03515 [Omnitrophica WOR_2 bacterium RIFOXYA2_FULL_38_17]